jgi:hypothetical protein
MDQANTFTMGTDKYPTNFTGVHNLIPSPGTDVTKSTLSSLTINNVNDNNEAPPSSLALFFQ